MLSTNLEELLKQSVLKNKSGIHSCLSKILWESWLGDRDRGITDGFCRDTQSSRVSIILSAEMKGQSLRSVWEERQQTPKCLLRRHEHVHFLHCQAAGVGVGGMWKTRIPHPDAGSWWVSRLSSLFVLTSSCTTEQWVCRKLSRGSLERFSRDVGCSKWLPKPQLRHVWMSSG